MIEQTKHVSQMTERYILGSMIMDVDALVTSADLLDWEMFYERKNQIVFNAVIDTYKETGKIDINLLSDTLGRDQTDRIGGGSFLCSLLDDVVTTANVRSQCKIVKKLYLLRRIEFFGMRVAEDARTEDDPDKLIQAISAQLLELSQEQREKKEPSVPAIISEIKATWRDIAAGKEVCVEANDELFGETILGWYPGHIITIGGYTSAGKSLLLSQIVVDAAEAGASQIIFSLEDSRAEKMYKILGNLSNVPQRNQIRGVFDDDERQRLDDAQKVVMGWPLLIYDDVRTIEAMRLKIKKAQMRGRVDIVCIDFIQNITAPGSLYEKMSHAAVTLQAMAKDLGVTMIVLSQTDNESARNPNSDFIGLKGAGELAAASDVVIWIKREKGQEANERDLRLSIRKNRAFGETGGRDLQFSPRWTRIEKRYNFKGEGKI